MTGTNQPSYVNENTEENQHFVQPYPRPHAWFRRFLESLMTKTHERPRLMKWFVSGVKVISVLLIAASIVLPILAPSLPAILAITVACTTIGTVSLFCSWAISFAQRNIFGFPTRNEPAMFAPNQFAYDDAKGELTIEHNHMPRLQITANNPESAGYVEGYMLGKAMRANLKKLNFLYWLVRPFIGAPFKDKSLGNALQNIADTIPPAYQQEMRGKVAGYNQWLTENHRWASKLTYNHYLLLQLLPDFHNYNPFKKPLVETSPTLGCTSIAMRVSNYTFFIRILDWPSYNVAGKTFLQVDRNIGNAKRTIDIANPLMSGVATAINAEGMLIQINVSPSEKVKTAPTGMPAIFFNRYCAENTSSVTEIHKLLETKSPLAAYHLNATDGINTSAMHLHQCPQQVNGHAIENLGSDSNKPQLLSVTNNGRRFKDGCAEDINHHDSNERKANIKAFFESKHTQSRLTNYIAQQQNDQPLSKDDIEELKSLCLQTARLAIVNNCRSVLCGIYFYYKGKLVEASAAVDNQYAQNQALSEFKQITIPSCAVTDAKNEPVRMAAGF